MITAVEVFSFLSGLITGIIMITILYNPEKEKTELVA